MDFSTYQREALRTDQVPGEAEEEHATALVVPMLGLAGETGQLLSEYKKHLRDGKAHSLFKERVVEELGDLLWYVSNVASKFGLDLEEIAERNLSKVRARWVGLQSPAPCLDEAFPKEERLPRRMIVKITQLKGGLGRPDVRMTINGEQIGHDLRDNSYDPDGYRFHDVFHLAYAAVLGWSPNIRAFLKKKRKSLPLLDEVEDGGRARVIEEAVSALAFDYARAHNFLDGVSDLDFELLRTIQSMTAHLEVRSASPADWREAIIQGYAVWRDVLANGGGEVLADLEARKLQFLGPA